MNQGTGGGRLRRAVSGVVLAALGGLLLGPAATAAGQGAEESIYVPSERPLYRKPQFIRGDSNADGAADIADAVRILEFLFLGARLPDCLAAADVNGDKFLDISDASALLAYLFLSAPAPPAPGPASCGVDPADGGLPCESYPLCPDDYRLIAHVLGRITWGPSEELYRTIQTRADLVAYIEEQLAPPANYDPAVHEPVLHARIQGLGIGPIPGVGLGEQVARLKASLLAYALSSRWQLLQVITQFWENHFHTQVDALRENFFQAGGRGGGALNASPELFNLADADRNGQLTQIEWDAFRALHPGVIAWAEFGARLIQDGFLTQTEFIDRGQIAYWKYASGGEQMGIAAEMERRENEFFRRHAFGRFRTLLEGSAKGVPMLIYLNGFENTVRAPNENYARELLELHTLGADRVYTQRDIEQLAKVLTGWSAGWVERARFDPAADLQYTAHPEAQAFPINLREPRPVQAPTREYWDDRIYTWAFVLNARNHDWDRKDLFLDRYGGVDSLGNPVPRSESISLAAVPGLDGQTIAAALGEWDRILDRLVAFRDCRKFIVTKLIQLLVTDDLAALSKTAPIPAEVRAMFQAADRDGDGAIERTEWEEPIPLVLPNGKPPEVFDELDGNGDGRLTLAEFREPDLVLAAMARWQATGGDVREVLRAILLSDEFLSLKFEKAKVKTPFEQVIGTARILGAAITDQQLKTAANEMVFAGMELYQFADPTGESELGFDWMHTTGLLERLKWINRAVNPENAQQGRIIWPLTSFLNRYQLRTPEEIADFFIQLIHPAGILENDRLLALKVYAEAPGVKAAALAAFLLSLAPAMQQ